MDKFHVADGASAEDDGRLTSLQLPGTFAVAVSNASGEAYRLWLSVPREPPPAAGYPLIVAIDAARTFGTLRDAVAMQAGRPDVTGAEPAVVCGIVYATEDGTDDRRRAFDLTPPSDRATLPPHPSGGGWPPTGGAPAFLEFLVGPVLSRIGRVAPIDPTRRTLFGHSLGGLLVVLTYLAGSGFSCFAAASPSLWVVPDAVENALEAFVSPSGDIRRLLMLAGGAEQPTGDATDERSRRQQTNRILDRARELVAALAARNAVADLMVLEGENHASMIPRAIARAVPFALGKPAARA